MSPLKVEIYNQEVDLWARVCEVGFSDGQGSISDNHAEGRDVYLFGVDPVENQGYIKKSKLGVDFEVATHRSISSAAFVTIAALNAGESHELTVKTDISPEPRRLKFTYYE